MAPPSFPPRRKPVMESSISMVILVTLTFFLSFPEKYGRTIRPQTVIVKALDENGEEVTLTGIDEMAKCFCHELDHLDGVCFVDKVTEWL